MSAVVSQVLPNPLSTYVEQLGTSGAICSNITKHLQLSKRNNPLKPHRRCVEIQSKLGMVAHSWNSSTWEAATGAWQV